MLCHRKMSLRNQLMCVGLFFEEFKLHVPNQTINTDMNKLNEHPHASIDHLAVPDNVLKQHMCRHKSLPK